MRLYIPSMVIAVMALAGCATETASEPEGNGDRVSEIQARLCDGMTEEICQRRLDALAEIDLAECAAKSGEIVVDGRLGLPLCRETYADAGEACTGSEDCEGLCIGSAGSGTEPACQAYTPLFGCYASYEGGEVDYEICVD